MFRLTRPTDQEIESQIKSVSSVSGCMNGEHLAPDAGLVNALPPGFAHDRLRTQIGYDLAAFRLAVEAFRSWRHFALGWVRVANPSARIEPGQVVAVEVHSLWLWSLNLSQIVYVVETCRTFGFIYRTTEHHVESGEERFLLTLAPDTGAVWYETEAVSRPHSLLARIGYPATRAFQHRFARDSHRRMAALISGRN